MKTIQFKALLLAALVLANPVAMHAQSKTDMFKNFFQTMRENPKTTVAVTAFALFATVAGFYYGYIPNPFSLTKEAENSTTPSVDQEANKASSILKSSVAAAGNQDAARAQVTPVTLEQAPVMNSVSSDAADAQAAADLTRKTQEADEEARQREAREKADRDQREQEETARLEAERQAQVERLEREEAQEKAALNTMLKDRIVNKATLKVKNAGTRKTVRAALEAKLTEMVTNKDSINNAIFAVDQIIKTNITDVALQQAVMAAVNEIVIIYP